LVRLLHLSDGFIISDVSTKNELSILSAQNICTYLLLRFCQLTSLSILEGRNFSSGIGKD